MHTQPRTSSIIQLSEQSLIRGHGLAWFIILQLYKYQPFVESEEMLIYIGIKNGFPMNPFTK